MLCALRCGCFQTVSSRANRLQTERQRRKARAGAGTLAPTPRPRGALHGETVTVLESDTPCERSTVPARSAPNPVAAANASVPVTPPHVSTCHSRADPGRTRAPSAVRSGKVIEVDAVATSRLPSTNPVLSLRSKWTTLTTPAGAVQVNGVATVAAAPDGAVIWGGAGTSRSNAVLESERRRDTTLVLEAGRQVTGTRSARGTSMAKPRSIANAGGVPAWAMVATESAVPSEAGTTTSRVPRAHPVGGRVFPEI